MSVLSHSHFGDSNIILFIVALVKISLNKMDNYESAAPKGEGKAATGRQPPPLKTLEDMLYNNKITEKKKEINRTQSIADTERLWTEIDTDMKWVLPESRSIRRRLGKSE
jgi:hypothetical protein